ncbi:MAG: chorismate synthase [Thermotogaceae bacterium]|jgi:chorismate synthase|nr:chorismate synthase [Thermotogaceae bacterium]
MIEVLTAGDSHGEALFGIVSGFPAGFEVDIDRINSDLLRRQGGYGRGKRMQLEHDKVEILSGLWNGTTTGAPLTFVVKNRAKDLSKEPRYIPRPGHADYSAWKKFDLQDLNIYVERSSARSSAMTVAIGSFFKQFLEKFNIRIEGFVKSIGNIELDEMDFENIDELVKLRDKSELYCPDIETTDRMKELIDSAKEKGDTLGGSFVVVAKNVPAGLGNYSQPENRLDARLALEIMGIPSVKGVLIGDILKTFKNFGSEAHDEFQIKNGKVRRTTNRAGGIEGGISNGEDVVITALLKPIPTLSKGLRSVNIKENKEETAPYVRSDVVVLPAASVVGEAVVSKVVACELLKRYGGDNFHVIYERWQKDAQ